ncbi:opioid growth factor receptor-like isoform X1 [Genypterus blacodes]|uniref:opioid growth factor receptor-like isoform X1 n=1 Tax=Genypterus blacodes TaxID=154954 RepID=UPI003F772A51
MVNNRNRNRSQKYKNREITAVRHLRKMGIYRFKWTNVWEWLRRFCVAVWNRRSVFKAITALFSYLALTFRRRGEQIPGDPETSETSEPLSGQVPQDTEEPPANLKIWSKTPAKCEQEPTEEVMFGGEEEEEEEQSEEESDSRDYRVDETDELYCEYDSTWETVTNYERTRETNPWSVKPRVSNYKFNRFKNAARDMQNYRRNYPSRSSTLMWHQDDKPNLKFYKGLRTSAPDEVHIDVFHRVWYGQYDQLEYVHSYIQWLFPLQEPGMNSEATPLTNEEIKDFLRDSTAMDNLLKSYKLMLDFYGIELCDVNTGAVKRARNWRERFCNMDRHTHNNLRITRILKCLGTLGLAHYQAPLVKFFLEETLVRGQLQNVKDSVLNYFVFAVLDKTKRRSLIEFAFSHYYPQDEFVWCPHKIQLIWSRQNHQREMISEDNAEEY